MKSDFSPWCRLNWRNQHLQRGRFAGFYTDTLFGYYSDIMFRRRGLVGNDRCLRRESNTRSVGGEDNSRCILGNGNNICIIG